MVKHTYVLGVKYDIELLDTKEMKTLGKCDNFVFGMCNFDTKTIYLNKDIKSIRIRRETLTHELVHAFFYESGLDEECDYAKNEELIDWIAIQLPKIMISLDTTKIFEDELKKENKDDSTRNNKSVTTPAKQNGVRDANKHGAKILR